MSAVAHKSLADLMNQIQLYSIRKQARKNTLSGPSTVHRKSQAEKGMQWDGSLESLKAISIWAVTDAQCIGYLTRGRTLLNVALYENGEAQFPQLQRGDWVVMGTDGRLHIAAHEYFRRHYDVIG